MTDETPQTQTGKPLVECTTCGLPKKPRGRHAAADGQLMCNFDCEGYQDEPRPGTLWPGETWPPTTATEDTPERPDVEGLRKRLLSDCPAAKHGDLLALCDYILALEQRPPEPGEGEKALRRAVVGVLCSRPPKSVGACLRDGLNEARGDAHPEDRCERCCQPFGPWTTSPADWGSRTGRSYGGPILCRPCFDELPVTPRTPDEARDPYDRDVQAVMMAVTDALLCLDEPRTLSDGDRQEVFTAILAALGKDETDDET